MPRTVMKKTHTSKSQNGRRCKDARADDENIYSEEDAAQVAVQKVDDPHMKKTLDLFLAQRSM